jgi:hypothetical protein
MSSYGAFFGFKSEPFSSEIGAKNLLKLPSMVSVKERFDYVMNGGVFVVTGEVGSGKSTSLRWSQSQYHPSQYLFLNLTATGGSLIEFYRQLCWDLDIEMKTGSRASVLKIFKGFGSVPNPNDWMGWERLETGVGQPVGTGAQTWVMMDGDDARNEAVNILSWIQNKGIETVLNENWAIKNRFGRYTTFQDLINKLQRSGFSSEAQMLTDSIKQQEEQKNTMTGGSNMLVTLALVGAGIFAISKFSRR